MTFMRTGPPPPRCRYGLRMISILTRCYMKPGHNGPCTAKGLKKFPYQRIHWFRGDAREFITDADHEFAWSERKPRGKTGETDD